MRELNKTVLHDAHLRLGAKMVDFAGWEMPLFYSTGIIAEHLTTRKSAGLFDISHMGRFIIRGANAVQFLQHALTNNADALEVGESQYTIIPNQAGGAIDDAYLYRFVDDEFLLVVNAANRQKDWEHLQALAAFFSDLEISDRSNELAMLALQGPSSRGLLEQLTHAGLLPEPLRNANAIVKAGAITVLVARTGYTGEPLCFELFVEQRDALELWNLLMEQGATPAGLGARDTLRLEAGLALYGHELGQDPDGNEIPILAYSKARFAVSLSPLKGNFVGMAELAKQHAALERIVFRDYSLVENLPRMIRPFAMVGRGVARAGFKVYRNGRHVGYVTSGTTVPMWEFDGEGLESVPTDTHRLRAIGLALLDSDILEEDRVEVEIRGKLVEAVIVPYHIRSEAPPYARPIVYGYKKPEKVTGPGSLPESALNLLTKAIDNTRWRQEECMNLIPSEMTPSPLVRLVSGMDSAFRYAEHKKVEAFYENEIFYYQGTDFIGEVERLLGAQICTFLECEEVETRLLSGQLANMAVFSAFCDYINRGDRKREPRRIRRVMNHYIGKGGHLSSQPMGALRDFVARDPQTERPAVVNFPVLPENRYKTDVRATLELIDEYRPELIIFGKSMFLHKEPVVEVRRFLDSRGIEAFIKYDMAHVLGLVGPHFQKPFEEGADFVTGSTHKTFFGTQRGIVASCYLEHDKHYELWKAVRRRTFPGSVSNHHLGTLVGLLMSTYEMNHFKDPYQPKVISNAKAFARALNECGLQVAGDPDIGFTETHQVIVLVGYARGPEMAKRLEANNIICNFQATPDEEGFSASGALRLGVAEMTRFGMNEEDFGELAQLMRDVIVGGKSVKDEILSLRRRFCELRYSFRGAEFAAFLEELRGFF